MNANLDSTTNGGPVDHGRDRAAAHHSHAERPAKVLLVDDHLVVAETIAMALETQPDLECIGVAATLEAARRLNIEHRPDIALIDVDLPDGDGIDGSVELRRVNPPLLALILTGHTDINVLARAAAAGVVGFLPKESGLHEVLRALRAARSGDMVVSSAALSAVLERMRGSSRPARQRAEELFTNREIDVLRRMAAGEDPQAIARRLGMSINTCRGHVKSILSKLDAHSQLEAVVIAQRRGLLPELLGA